MTNKQLLPLVGILGLINNANAETVETQIFDDSVSQISAEDEGLGIDPEMFFGNLSSTGGENIQATYTDNCGQFSRARLVGPMITKGQLDELNLYYKSPSFDNVEANLLVDHFIQGSTRGTGFLEWTRDGEVLDLEIRSGGLFSTGDKTDIGLLFGGRAKTSFLTAEFDSYTMTEDLPTGVRGYFASILPIGEEGREVYLSVGGKTLENQLVSTAAMIHPEGEGFGFYNKTVVSIEEGDASVSGEFAISTGSFNRNTLDTRTRIYNGAQMVGANTSVSGRWGYAPFTALGVGTLDVKWNDDLTGSVTAYAKHMDTGSLAGLSVVRTLDEEGVADLGFGVTSFFVLPINDKFTVEAGGEVTLFRNAGLVPAFAYVATKAEF